MPETIVKVDLTKSPYENDMVHNRWHPDIPIVAWVNPGDDFIMETYDWTGGFIKNNDSADDVRDIAPGRCRFGNPEVELEGTIAGGPHLIDPCLDLSRRQQKCTARSEAACIGDRDRQ